MRRKGYQLTRYADDWVVTCASAVEARAALEAASRVLKELGVTINPQKARIVHVRHGFEFLGYKIKRGSRPMNPPTSKIKTRARRGSLYAFAPAPLYSLIRVADAEDHRDRGRSWRARHKACYGAEPIDAMGRAARTWQLRRCM
jgi:hypothetical protein